VRRFLYDTAIFSYALGGEHHYREPCREIVRMAAAGDLQGEASVDLLQELAHQRLRRTGDRAGAGAASRNIAKLVCCIRSSQPTSNADSICSRATPSSTLATRSSPPSPSTARSTRCWLPTVPSTASTA
jgi:predicted nucleic acid-binding protein